MKEVLETLKEILAILKEMGLSFPLIIGALILLAIVVYADNLEKLKRLLISPFYKLRRWFARAYISKSVSLPLSNFINKEILPFIDNVEHKKIRVKFTFVSRIGDIRQRKNKLIIRLKEDIDQDKHSHCGQHRYSKVHMSARPAEHRSKFEQGNRFDGSTTTSNQAWSTRHLCVSNRFPKSRAGQ